MNKKELLDILRGLHIRPTKSKGQNFLISESVVERMVEESHIASSDTVLEIGPGLGILTHCLAKSAKRVLAVELDDTLFAYLKDTFADSSNVQIISSDILEFNPANISGTYHIVANLPYQITSAVLRKFLTAHHKPKEITVMVQKEVAQRICAKEGDHSVLSLSVQYYGNPRTLFLVHKHQFYPIPEVDSAVLQIQQIEKKDAEEEKWFFRCIKAGFSHKRKKLISNLVAHQLGSKEFLTEKLQEMGYESGVRAQHVSLSNWIALSMALKRDKDGDKL